MLFLFFSPEEEAKSVALAIWRRDMRGDGEGREPGDRDEEQLDTYLHTVISLYVQYGTYFVICNNTATPYHKSPTPHKLSPTSAAKRIGRTLHQESQQV